MKSSIKTMFMVLAIVMSFVAVQAVWAATVDPTDTITVIGRVKSFHEPTGIVLTAPTVNRYRRQWDKKIDLRIPLDVSRESQRSPADRESHRPSRPTAC